MRRGGGFNDQEAHLFTLISVADDCIGCRPILGRSFMVIRGIGLLSSNRPNIIKVNKKLTTIKMKTKLYISTFQSSSRKFRICGQTHYIMCFLLPFTRVFVLILV